MNTNSAQSTTAFEVMIPIEEPSPFDTRNRHDFGRVSMQVDGDAKETNMETDGDVWRREMKDEPMR